MYCRTRPHLKRTVAAVPAQLRFLQYSPEQKNSSVCEHARTQDPAIRSSPRDGRTARCLLDPTEQKHDYKKKPSRSSPDGRADTKPEGQSGPVRRTDGRTHMYNIYVTNIFSMCNMTVRSGPVREMDGRTHMYSMTHRRADHKTRQARK